MGWGRMTSSDWDGYTTAHVAGKTTAQVFTSSSMEAEFDPARIQFRESVDSPDNPRSTPVILGCDVTGSMGMIADRMIRDGLNEIAQGIYDQVPITDPHIAVMAIGDANYDSAPLQVTQFEADIRIADQTRRLWLERGGGINRGETYALAHVFAARKTLADAFTKRRKKGHLITIGDEPALGVTREQCQRFLGIDVGRDLTAAECATLAREHYHVYHIVLKNEGYAVRGLQDVLKSWANVVPGNLVELSDIGRLPETVLDIIKSAEAGTSPASSAVAVAQGRSTAGAVRLQD